MCRCLKFDINSQCIFTVVHWQIYLVPGSRELKGESSLFLISVSVMLVSDYLATRPFATMRRDHGLLFQSCSSQRLHPFSFFIEQHCSQVQLSAICCHGQSGRDIDFILLGLPSVASGVCAVVQISPSKRQCGERQASLKQLKAIAVVVIMSVTHEGEFVKSDF